MHTRIAELLSLAGGAIAEPEPHDSAVEYLGRWGALGASLAEVLSQTNGFYAFDAALLVRPLRHQSSPVGIVEWNVPSLWKGEFADDLSGVLFFAEDFFGGQFGIRGKRICIFEPETGDCEDNYSSLGDWADALLSDDALTGYSLTQTWKAKMGILQSGTRLVPKTPFVCGGAYEIDNLYPIDDVAGMTFRSSIANQIRDLPDGAEIILDFQNDDEPSL